MFQQSLCILRRPWCSLFCSHNEGSFVDFFNFLNVFFRAKVYFFYPQDLNSGIKFLAIPFTQERGSKIHLSAQCLLYQLKSRQEQPGGPLQARWSSNQLHIIHVLCLIFLKEFVKKGPRHVSSFQNTLINVDNGNLVDPYKRFGHRRQLNYYIVYYIILY